MFSLAVEGKYMEKEMKNENSRLPNWVQARLNKDNFWNLVFGVGVTISFMLAGIFKSRLLLVAMLVLVSYLTKKACNTQFTTDKKYLNFQGLDISNKIPKSLFGVIIFTITATIISIKIDIPLLTFFTICFSPSLYFIIINCPISILFNLQLYRHNMQFVKSSSTDWTHDPQQCNVAGNIYYNNHNSYYLNNHHR